MDRSTRYGFGPFELDVESGVLRRDGRQVPLTAQPIKLLQLLVERSGQVVTREDIRDRLWGHAFLEVDQGINRCIREIRSALLDDARRPAYVETLVGRGYRFVAPVTEDRSQIAIRAPAAANASRGPARWTRPHVVVTTGSLLATLSLVLILAAQRGPERPNSDAWDLPQATMLELARAQALLERDQGTAYALAIDALDRVVAQHPEYAPGHARLAYAHSVLDGVWGRPGHRRLAADHARRAESAGADHPSAWWAAAAVAYQDGDYAAALAKSSRAVELDPTDLYSSLLLGRTLEGLNRWDEAAVHLERAFEAHPRSVELASALARNYLFRHRFEDADELLQHVSVLTPDHRLPWLIRPLLPIWRDADTEAAAEAIDESARAIGLGTTILTSRPLARIYGRRLVETPQLFSRGQVSVMPTRYHLSRADAFWFAGYPDEAETEYRAAKRGLEDQIGAPDWEDGKSVEPLIMLAAAEAGLGAKDRAMELVDLTLRQLPMTRLAPDALLLRQFAAEVLVRIGQEERALDQLEFLMSSRSLVTTGLLRADPVWDPLRDHPRFHTLLNGHEALAQIAFAR